jgi:predicted metal-binding transcription factor (methanogenesis marker protein 9)
MFQNDMELAGFKFDLQFFGADATDDSQKTDSTPNESNPSTVSNDQAIMQSEETEESFIDPNLIPEELRTGQYSKYYKGMSKAFTQKSQEIAEFKKVCKELGMTPQMAAKALNEVNQMVANVKSISESQGEEAAIDYLAKSLGITRKQAQKLTGGDQSQIEDPFADDEYAKVLKQKIKEEAIREAEERLAQKYDPILQKYQADEAERAKQFFEEINTSIKKVMDDFKGLLPANVTQEVLFNCAKTNKIDPKQMEAALMMTLGPAEYNKLVERKTIQNLQKNALENKKAVGPVMSAASGNTPKTGDSAPNDFGQAKKEILSIFKTLKNSS